MEGISQASRTAADDAVMTWDRHSPPNDDAIDVY